MPWPSILQFMKIALNSKLCAGSSRSKNNISVDMNRNIKEVYGLLKQPVS